MEMDFGNFPKSINIMRIPSSFVQDLISGCRIHFLRRYPLQAYKRLYKYIYIAAYIYREREREMPALLRLKIDLVSYPSSGEVV